MSTEALSHLSDRDLLAAVSRLATGQRDATVSLIAHLAELHARRLHQRAGFSSLYTYCIDVVGLSESEAYDRVKAAKLVRRYPALLTLLAAGQINLTTVRLVAPLPQGSWTLPTGDLANSASAPAIRAMPGSTVLRAPKRITSGSE